MDLTAVIGLPVDKINTPENTPANSDTKTFLVLIARPMVRMIGINDKILVSITNLLTVLPQYSLVKADLMI